MKRSEASIIMKANIKLDLNIHKHALLYQQGEISWGKFAEVLANKALFIAEHIIEMNPPTITIMPDVYNKAEDNYGYKINEWENEFTESPTKS